MAGLPTDKPRAKVKGSRRGGHKALGFVVSQGGATSQVRAFLCPLLTNSCDPTGGSEGERMRPFLEDKDMDIYLEGDPRRHRRKEGKLDMEGEEPLK